MNLTEEEKNLLTLYKKFYGIPFDCLDLRLYDSFHNMYCILQTIPEAFGGHVNAVGDFEILSTGGVYSDKVYTIIILLSKASYAVRDFYKENKIDTYLPVASASMSPDIDLSSDQGIAPYNDFSLLAQVCLYVSQGHTNADEVRDYINKMTYKEENILRGNRNLYQVDYIISLLAGYGVLSYDSKKTKDNTDVYTLLTPEEKEVLRSYYSFYGNEYDPKKALSVENAMNAICILQSVDETSGCYLKNKYPFTAASADRVTSSELKIILDNLNKKNATYNVLTIKKAPIAEVLKSENFDTVEKLGRFASACVYAKEHPEATRQELLDYLNTMAAIDVDFGADDHNFNKKVIILLERFGIVKRNIQEIEPKKKESHQNEGLVRKLAKIFGRQK